MNQNNKYNFIDRHLGYSKKTSDSILSYLGYKSEDEFIKKVIPSSILEEDLDKKLKLSHSFTTEEEALEKLEEIFCEIKPQKSFMGQGYTNSYLPSVIKNNFIQDPVWYSSYTPYQAEISQGRLELLYLFQTMIAELTDLPVANSSMLDEGTCGAEALTLCFNHYLETERIKDPSCASKKFFISSSVYPHIIGVIKHRASMRSIGVEVGDESLINPSNYFGVLLQNPGRYGDIKDYTEVIKNIKEKNPSCLVSLTSDLLSLTLIKSPGSMGADICFGTTRQFGMGLGLGGPAAAFFAVREDLLRKIPGRLVGKSIDAMGKTRYRLALQTREQHIRREKASSNLCTAQVLTACVSLLYFMYHGKTGVIQIAKRVNNLTQKLFLLLKEQGLTPINSSFFDTLFYKLDSTTTNSIQNKEKELGISLYIESDKKIKDILVGITLDETTTEKDLTNLVKLFSSSIPNSIPEVANLSIPDSLKREDNFLTQDIFNTYTTELKFSRFINQLSNKDFSLVNTMIPLGSCTMKLNPSFTLSYILDPRIRNAHPYESFSNIKGALKLLEELNQDLCTLLGFDKFVFSPLSGASGEACGLAIIKAYLRDKKIDRNICLIPASAHGTNPASATCIGYQVVVVKCDDKGNISVDDLKEKLEKYKDQVATMMITYPSTHGVFEQKIKDICNLLHDNKVLVYMDGANFNAQLGLTRPGLYGADVCHINLHKSFSLPHGGGGPGVGPVGVRSFLIPYLPSNSIVDSLCYDSTTNTITEVFKEEDIYPKTCGAVSSAPWGNFSFLTIAWLYINAMGVSGLKQASIRAILSANYISKKLANYYPTLYTGETGLVAHECILDLSKFKKEYGVTEDDVAKRLMDYGFHAPTMSFPVHSTLMVEPTESEPIEELDRFCDSMIKIKQEIIDIKEKSLDPKNNLLKNAPHPMEMLSNWDKPYSIKEACFPMDQYQTKAWPFSARIDNTYGDRNLKLKD